MTLFALFQPTRSPLMQGVLSPFVFCLLRRLLCLLNTFGSGSPLAYYAMPRIVRSCALGDPRGLIEVALLYT